MKSIDRLLRVVDPDTDSDFIIQRAKLIAEKYNSSVLLFISKPKALNPNSISSKSPGSLFFKKQQQLFAEQYEKMLQVLRGEFSAMKIRASAEFSSAKSSSDAILKKILEYKPDITLKSIQKLRALKNILITNTDWFLIQNSPCPLLLVKFQEWHNDGCIIAAVDPLHIKAQQNQLDHLLLDTTANLAKNLQLTCRAFHIYLRDMGTMFPKVLDAGDQIKEVKRNHQEKVEELAKAHGINPENVTLAKGDLIKSLLLCMKKERGNILVLGALSRNFVERAIVGSTAERILYDTPCNVLIMKNTQTAHQFPFEVADLLVADIFRVLTLNIHKGFAIGPRRLVLSNIRECLRASGANLVFLQEVVGANARHQKNISLWPEDSQLEYLADTVWSHHAYGKNAIYQHGHHGNTILSEHPFVAWDNIGASFLNYSQRGFLHGTLTGNIHLISVHLGLFENERLQQVLLLIDYVKRHAPEGALLIIAGDFNDWRKICHRALIEHLQVQAVQEQLNGICARAFPAFYPLLAMDRIYLRGFTISASASIAGESWRDFSDNCALTADIQVRNTP